MNPTLPGVLVAVSGALIANLAIILAAGRPGGVVFSIVGLIVALVGFGMTWNARTFWRR